MKFPQLATLAHQTVSATQARLPVAIRKLALAVPVHYEPKPSDAIVEEGFETDILGLFSGPAHGDAIGEDNLLPPQIFLYLDNLWDFAEGDQNIFCDEVRLTYLHELGHYFGWDEDDLAARGLD
jgi:predicted Zn-dependent protease with MMP-like domain